MAHAKFGRHCRKLTMTRDEAIDLVLATYQTLLHQDDLSPDNHAVTDCLGRFIQFLTAHFHEDWAPSLPDAPDLAQAAVQLPRLCGLAECEMEKWWCRRFLAQKEFTAQSLGDFWYYDNYSHLIEAELSLFGEELSGSLTFFGSGALPLTAILLARSAPGLFVRCIDRDPEAVGLGRRLLEKLGLNSRIELIEASAEDFYFPPGQLAICASLLDAPGLFDAFARRGVETFVTRDAEGLFRLCYRSAPLPPRTYRLTRWTPPSNGSINTSRLYRLA